MMAKLLFLYDFLQTILPAIVVVVFRNFNPLTVKVKKLTMIQYDQGKGANKKFEMLKPL